MFNNFSGYAMLVALAPVAALALGFSPGWIVFVSCALSVALALAFAIRQPRDSRVEYEALLETVGELVMRHDANGSVLSVSEAARPLFGCSPEALKGGGLLKRVHVADRPAFLQLFDTAYRSDSSTCAIVRLKSEEAGGLDLGRTEPAFAWAEIRARRLPGNAGPGAILSVTRNITASKELEDRLESARAESSMALTLRDRLLANISHELRTPLNAILGFSEMLGDRDLIPSDEVKRIEYARIIHSSAEHLLSVVNLVLDMSRIEAGKFEIMAEPFELEPLLKDCCDMLRLKAEAGSVALSITPMPPRLEIVADKRALRQVLLNLLSNAVKFTPPGGRVTAGVTPLDKLIHVQVADTGIGIASDDLPRLGYPFVQLRSSYDRKYEGAGLGLSLVRGLVGLLGGTLLLESAEGVGTRVTVRLPTDCRDAPRRAGSAPGLETAALSAPHSALHIIEPSKWTRVEGERKIA